ncbi:MAG: LOG family protein, partial [Candidatus Omnitrophica bacterium]|nr:LOG family protein [Candidatus Omnitrophota bacterium]
MTAWLVLACLIPQEAWAFVPPRPVAAAIMPAFHFVLPESVGLVEDGYAPSAQAAERPKVILFQDAHTNPSGQFNLASALERVVREYRVGRVYVEGGWGDCSLNDLKNSADPARLRSAAERFVRSGELNGEEYLSLTSDLEFSILGAEEKELYGKGLEAYAAAARSRDEALRYLDRIRRGLKDQEHYVFDPDLTRFEAAREKYHAGDLNFADWIGTLLAAAAKQGVYLGNYRNLRLFRRLSSLERSVKFDRLAAEQKDAAATLEAVERSEFDRLLTAGSTGARDDSDSARGAYLFFGEKLGARIARYPNLGRYVRYVRESRRLSAAGALDELAALETEVLGRLTLTPHQKLLIEFKISAALIEKLIRLQITPQEYADLLRRGGRSGAEYLSGFVNARIMDRESGYEGAIVLKESLKAAETAAKRFYVLAADRDQLFLSAVERRLAENASEPVVLITGGFHTFALKQQLRARGISFLSILPQVREETDQARYERLLMKQLHPQPEASDLSGAPGISKTTQRISPIVIRPEALTALTDHTRLEDGPLGARMANGEHLRTLGNIVVELNRLKEMANWLPAVTVFGSARIPATHPFYWAAYELGRQLGKEGIAGRTGAGPSIMEAVPIGILATNPNRPELRQGIRIELPFEQETNPYIDLILRFDHFLTRKRALDEKVITTVAMPGGIGTMDEFFEAMRRGRPTVLFGEKFWWPVWDAFQDAWHRSGILQPLMDGTHVRPFITDNISSVMDFIRNQQRFAAHHGHFTTPGHRIDELIGELDDAYLALHRMPEAVTMIGHPVTDSHLLDEAERFAALAWNRGIYIRIASAGSLERRVWDRARADRREDYFQSVVFKPGTTGPVQLNPGIPIPADQHIDVGDESLHQFLTAAHSSSFVFLPGGFGTMNRLFDIVQLMQVKKVKRQPIVLLGRDHWQPVLDSLRKIWLETDGVPAVVSPADMDLFRVADTAEEALIEILKPVGKPTGARMSNSALPKENARAEQLKSLIHRLDQYIRETKQAARADYWLYRERRESGEATTVGDGLGHYLSYRRISEAEWRQGIFSWVGAISALAVAVIFGVYFSEKIEWVWLLAAPPILGWGVGRAIWSAVEFRSFLSNPVYYDGLIELTNVLRALQRSGSESRRVILKNKARSKLFALQFGAANGNSILKDIDAYLNGSSMSGARMAAREKALEILAMDPAQAGDWQAIDAGFRQLKAIWAQTRSSTTDDDAPLRRAVARCDELFKRSVFTDKRMNDAWRAWGQTAVFLANLQLALTEGVEPIPAPAQLPALPRVTAADSGVLRAAYEDWFWQMWIKTEYFSTPAPGKAGLIEQGDDTPPSVDALQIFTLRDAGFAPDLLNSELLSWILKKGSGVVESIRVSPSGQVGTAPALHITLTETIRDSWKNLNTRQISGVILSSGETGLAGIYSAEAYEPYTIGAESNPADRALAVDRLLQVLRENRFVPAGGYQIFTLKGAQAAGDFFGRNDYEKTALKAFFRFFVTAAAAYAGKKPNATPQSSPLDRHGSVNEGVWTDARLHLNLLAQTLTAIGPKGFAISDKLFDRVIKNAIRLEKPTRAAAAAFWGQEGIRADDPDAVMTWSLAMLRALLEPNKRKELPVEFILERWRREFGADAKEFDEHAPAEPETRTDPNVRGKWLDELWAVLYQNIRLANIPASQEIVFKTDAYPLRDILALLGDMEIASNRPEASDPFEVEPPDLEAIRKGQNPEDQVLALADAVRASGSAEAVSAKTAAHAAEVRAFYDSIAQIAEQAARGRLHAASTAARKLFEDPAAVERLGEDNFEGWVGMLELGLSEQAKIGKPKKSGARMALPSVLTLNSWYQVITALKLLADQLDQGDTLRSQLDYIRALSLFLRKRGLSLPLASMEEYNRDMYPDDVVGETRKHVVRIIQHLITEKINRKTSRAVQELATAFPYQIGDPIEARRELWAAAANYDYDEVRAEDSGRSFFSESIRKYIHNSQFTIEKALRQVDWYLDYRDVKDLNDETLIYNELLEREIDRLKASGRYDSTLHHGDALGPELLSFIRYECARDRGVFGPDGSFSGQEDLLKIRRCLIEMSRGIERSEAIESWISMDVVAKRPDLRDALASLKEKDKESPMEQWRIVTDARRALIRAMSSTTDASDVYDYYHLYIFLGSEMELTLSVLNDQKPSTQLADQISILKTALTDLHQSEFVSRYLMQWIDLLDYPDLTVSQLANVVKVLNVDFGMNFREWVAHYQRAGHLAFDGDIMQTELALAVLRKEKFSIRAVDSLIDIVGERVAAMMTDGPEKRVYAASALIPQTDQQTFGPILRIDHYNAKGPKIPFMRMLYGSKGLYLSEMNAMGLPVPSGFIIPSTTSRQNSLDHHRDTFIRTIDAELDQLEQDWSLKSGQRVRIGDPESPMWVAVRTGSMYVMPGILETINNLGWTPELLRHEKERLGTSSALISYATFLESAAVVLGMDRGDYESEENRLLSAWKVRSLSQLGEDDLQSHIVKMEKFIRENLPEAEVERFLSDPRYQIAKAVEVVIQSWHKESAVAYRRENGISDDWRTPVIVQAYVFGDSDASSGTGIARSHDKHGTLGINGEWIRRAQGPDLVQGRVTPKPLDVMKREISPAVYVELDNGLSKLVNIFGRPFIMEFTVESGRLWVLQAGYDHLLEHPIYYPEARYEGKEILLGTGTTVLGEGAANVVAIMSLSSLKDPKFMDGVLKARGLDGVGIFRLTTNPEESAILIHAHKLLLEEGKRLFLLTKEGGSTSHGAITAAMNGMPSIVGIKGMTELTRRTASFGGITITAQALVGLDLTTGSIYDGFLNVSGLHETSTAEQMLMDLGKGARLAESAQISNPFAGRLTRFAELAERAKGLRPEDEAVFAVLRDPSHVVYARAGRRTSGNKPADTTTIHRSDPGDSTEAALSAAYVSLKALQKGIA